MTINRKFIFFVLLAFMIGLQCKSIHNSTSHKEMYKSIYIHQFKLTYVRQMLIKGFNNSNAVQELMRVDNSGFTEPILTTDDFKLIDSLTTIDELKMEMDSTERVGIVAEGAEGKHPLGFILDKLDSKWIDSIASKRYKSSGIQKFYPE